MSSKKIGNKGNGKQKDGVTPIEFRYRTKVGIGQGFLDGESRQCEIEYPVNGKYETMTCWVYPFTMRRMAICESYGYVPDPVGAEEIQKSNRGFLLGGVDYSKGGWDNLKTYNGSSIPCHSAGTEQQRLDACGMVAQLGQICGFLYAFAGQLANVVVSDDEKNLETTSASNTDVDMPQSKKPSNSQTGSKPPVT